MTTIYSVGINGSSKDSLMNTLAAVDYVVDVRATAWSQAARRETGKHHDGKWLAEQLGDKYIGCACLGVPKAPRADLKEAKDQEEMNGIIAKHIALGTIRWDANSIQEIWDLVKQGYKVALMCQEHAEDSCHRRYLITKVLGATLVELDARK